MKVKAALALTLSLSAINAQALEIDHCPLPENIKNTRGVFTANTVSRQGQWVGTVSAVRVKGGDSFSAESVASFNGAIFYSTKPGGVSRGILSRCLYSTRDGEKLDMYYRPEVRPELAVRLLDLKSWKLQPESKSGLQTYICKNKQQGGCVFALID
ncbi:DUF3757 domain-containing protein [Pseudomonas koreensis]|uniref:DUF3757 domain-containing protein n=1 Tax=Pseudomonas koreensis TaxID=198620 RepID=UPI0021C5794E|nr:DUF3757 domain-containing protein [Pseudomonas koreensis]MCU0074399.1 DUF3757 domain-containing protein [Pseudomonas koreensis]